MKSFPLCEFRGTVIAIVLATGFVSCTCRTTEDGVVIESSKEHHRAMPDKCDRIGNSEGDSTTPIWDDEFNAALTGCIARGVENDCWQWAYDQTKAARKGCR